MRYDLIASDFDDTLLPQSKSLSEYTIQTIKRYVENGGRFVLCTGRMFASISKVAAKLGLHGEVISYQGALTKNVDTDEVVDFTEFGRDLAVEYVKFLKKFPIVIQMYVSDSLYVEEENPYSKRYAEFCGIEFKPVGDAVKFLTETTAPINKIYAYVPEDKCADLRETAIKKFGDRLLINSSKPWNVEAVNINASKGKAVMNLAARYGIPAEKVMTFGDNLNDMDMIIKAGFGVAVGNAVSELKEVADYVTADCADDGVARAIEKFCL